METIITVELPLKRILARKRDQYYHLLPRSKRWFGWLYNLGRSSIQEFGGSRTNTVYRLELFRRHILTVRRNEYHDRTDKEMADEYLAKWSAAEKELRGLRLLVMGDTMNTEVKKLIRDSMGIDFDEGTVR